MELPDKGPDPEPDANPETFTDAAPWQAQNQGELKTDERLFQHRTTSDLSKGYLDAMDKIAGFKPGINVPTKESTDEEVREFLTAVGVPEESGKYGRLGEVEDGIKLDDESYARFSDMAFKVGINDNQFKAVQEWRVAERRAEIKASNDKKEADKIEITKHFEKEWGSDYPKNMGLLNKGINHFGGDEFLEVLNTTGLGNNPKMLAFLVEKGASIAGDPFLDTELTRDKKKLDPNHIHYKSME